MTARADTGSPVGRVPVPAGARAITGILLAAGRGRRFGGGKLLAVLEHGPDRGVPLGVAACSRLLRVIPDVVAVVRPQDTVLATALERAGARVVVADRADEGMGASLAAGVAAGARADGYVVALADMPWIEPDTIARVVRSLAGGASIAAPVYRGMRGHPVGFAAAHREALLALRDDEGARGLVTANREAVRLLDVEDPGVVRDVDSPADLSQAP